MGERVCTWCEVRHDSRSLLRTLCNRPDVCVEGASRVCGCFRSRVISCVFSECTRSPAQVAHMKTDAWHIPTECSCYSVNMYQKHIKSLFSACFLYT